MGGKIAVDDDLSGSKKRGGQRAKVSIRVDGTCVEAVA
jgi:hypothetical protein